VALPHGGGAAPQPQGAVSHKSVQRGGQAPACGFVKGFGVGNVNFVKFFRGSLPGRGHSAAS